MKNADYTLRFLSKNILFNDYLKLRKGVWNEKKCTLNEKFVIISKLDQEKSLNKHKAFKVTKKEKIKNKKVQKY